MNVYLPNLRLPSAYQEVEYIESSGAQRINTGIKVANDITYGFECKVSNLLRTGAATCIMEMGGTSNDDYRYGITYNPNTNIWQFGYNGGPNGWGRTIEGYGPTTTSTYTLQYNIGGNKAGTVNGTTVITGMNISNYNYASNWNIFCQTYGTTYSRYGEYRLHYMKIYHGSTLVRDFVPCYRKSDNVIGLYDLVNNQFYTNSGTGTFSKGNDVTMAELKNAYIGQYS